MRSAKVDASWNLYLEVTDPYLSLFDITLFFCNICHVIRKQKLSGSISKISIHPNTVWTYLERLKFPESLSQVIWLDLSDQVSPRYNPNLIEISVYNSDDGFNSHIPQIKWALSNHWIWEQTVLTIISLLWELVNNVFEHNLWKRSELWPVMWLTMHKYEWKLRIIVFDFWVWLSKTLEANYPWHTEDEYIKMAFEEGISWRERNPRQSDWSLQWWMWLTILKEYVIDRFWWRIDIVSNGLYMRLNNNHEFDIIKNFDNIEWVIVQFTIPENS